MYSSGSRVKLVFFFIICFEDLLLDRKIMSTGAVYLSIDCLVVYVLFVGLIS